MTYTVMKTNKTNYINNTTNEITTEQEQAMKWYNEGAEVAVWSWSETLQKMVERVVWVHQSHFPY